VASYLVENSIGGYDLTARVSNGIQFYQAQGTSIPDARKAINKIAIDHQEDITTFQTTFNGRYPFAMQNIQARYGGGNITAREARILLDLAEALG
jgi:hypothetical protein